MRGPGTQGPRPRIEANQAEYIMKTPSMPDSATVLGIYYHLIVCNCRSPASLRDVVDRRAVGGRLVLRGGQRHRRQHDQAHQGRQVRFLSVSIPEHGVSM